MTDEMTMLMKELFYIIHGISAVFAILRLGYSGLKYIAGYKEELSQAIRQVVIGLLVIYTAPTIVWLITTFAKAVPTFGGF
ncbi:MAG: hypothetical protein ACOCRK_06525 [bacterium]